MKKIYYLAGLMIAVASCTTTNKTTVTIHMEGKGVSEIPTALNTRDSIYSVILDSTNSATIQLASNLQSDYAAIQLGRMRLPLYIESGKSFDVAIKIEGRKVSPTFTGEGAAKNTYLNGDGFKDNIPAIELDEKAFMDALAQKETQLFANLEKENFEETFAKLEKKRIHYNLYSAISTYVAYHPYYGQQPNYRPSDELINSLKTLITEEPELADMPEYKNAVIGYIQILVNQTQTANPLDALKDQLNFIQNNFKSPEIMDFTIDHFAKAYVDRYGTENLTEFSAIYDAKVIDPKKKTDFKALCDKWSKIAQGQPSIDFKYLDINGKEISLKDLAGKYVYIDCWATWCGPCRGELPHLQKLEHQYKDKNIHFVSISCDQNKTAWEEMVKKDKLGGIQLHNGGDRTFMDFYMIKGIPRFILLDREGKIIQANATRPSNPETAKIFDALEGI